MKIEKILTRREMNAISGDAGNEPATPPPPPPYLASTRLI